MRRKMILFLANAVFNYPNWPFDILFRNYKTLKPYADNGLLITIVIKP